jgi:hypothetical protein
VCNTEPSCEATPTAVDFNLFLVVVTHLIVKFEINPLGYVWRRASDDFNPSALLLSAGNPIQDGLVAISPPSAAATATLANTVLASLAGSTTTSALII